MGLFDRLFSSSKKSLGEQMYDKQEYASAFEIFNRPENQSDSRSQYFCGLMLHNGLGVAQDVQLGAMKLIAAADSGDADAQNYVSVAFGDGLNGFHKDEARGIHYAQLAMSQNHKDAFANMGNRYLLGLGVEKNLTMAKTLLERGAALGSSQAEMTLSAFDILSK
jgi:TPR repeat protein